MVVHVACQPGHALLIGDRRTTEIDAATIGKRQRERHGIHPIAAVDQVIRLVIAEDRQLCGTSRPAGRGVRDLGGHATGEVAFDVGTDSSL